MPSLLELKRCWRDVRFPAQQVGNHHTWLWTDGHDAEALARVGLYHLGSLAKHECLVLLGRPGAGKTSEVARIVSGRVDGFADEYCVSVSCKDVNANIDEEIVRVPEWRAAERQSKPVRLILDALDEGYLREARYFAALRFGLRNLRSFHANLRLLLVCRPAEWDETFGKAVHDLWRGEEEPKTYTLEPLSTENQSALVRSWGIDDTEGLLRWVRSNNFEEFAVWPRSLKWLSAEFDAGETGRISYTQLCHRRAMRSFPEEDKRIEEAGRGDRVSAWTHALMLVAAVIVFCGKRGVMLDGSDAAHLTLEEIFRRGATLDMPGRPTLTRISVREAIRTSDLLEVHGGYHRFQNQSDLEFLAAAMLVSLELEQLSELFGCADESGCWRVFPPLATTAANLATQSREFFCWLLESDPRVLMRVDFASKSSEDKVAAIDALLEATAKANATAAHDEQSHFATLRHPRLEKQIRPWLCDESRSLAVRQLAFDIAFECCGPMFWSDFEQTVSAGQDEFLQSRLPSVILRFGRYWPQLRLQEIAMLPDTRLGGAAMRALLDQGWKPRALEPFLREPEGVPTSYHVLLSRQLPRECDVDDVAPLLTKIANWSSAGADGNEVRDLAEALIAKGVAALDRPDVRQALTVFIIARFKEDHWFFYANNNHPKSLAKLGLDCAEHRRGLLLLMAEIAWGDVPEIEYSSMTMPLLSEDYFWLLDKLTVATGRVASVLARLASGVMWQLGEEYFEAIDRAYSASGELRASFQPISESSFSTQLRLWRLETEERQRIRAEELRSEFPEQCFSHEEYLLRSLDKCRAGYLGWWTYVCHALSQPRSLNDSTKFIHGADARELPGWQAASAKLQVELAQFARNFLLWDATPEPPGRQIPHAFFGIVYAFSLHAYHLGTDSDLREAARPIWIQAILRRGGSSSESVEKYLTAISNVAPEIATIGYEREFRSIWNVDQPIYGEVFSRLWSPPIEDGLARVLEDSPIQPESYESGLNLLQKHNPVRAGDIARRRLLEHVNLPDSNARRAAVAVCFFTINSLWEEAWPSFVRDLSAARQLVLEHHRWLDFLKEDDRLSKMPAPFVAELYKMIMLLFPPNEAPMHEGARFLGPVDEAYDLQRALRETLESRGDYAGLEAGLEPYPELRQTWWVGRSLERARMNAHALRRFPPDATKFIQFLVTEGGTFVRDNGTLQRAVLASLRRFEKQLHPLIIKSLWEKQKPRDEESLQIEITRHLKSDFEVKGIVVNMEVKVEGKQGVDILVEASPFSVTLEIKQAHGTDKHRPVRESMRIQLRDTYLATTGGTHGIYVVGWYFCPAFRPRGLSAMKTINDARAYFAQQAESLSTDSFLIAVVVLNCGWKESIAARAKRVKSPKRKKSST